MIDVAGSRKIGYFDPHHSAFPHNTSVHYPYNFNLKIDLLAEMQIPCIFSMVDAGLKAKQMKSDVEECLMTRHQGSSFLSELKQKLLLLQNEAVQPGTRYNIPLINSLLLYVGLQDHNFHSISALAVSTVSSNYRQNPHLPLHNRGPKIIPWNCIGRILLGYIDNSEDQLGYRRAYHFLNAMANQLQYPSNQTHLFSYVLLYLFKEAKQEIIQEQITRVLSERMIVKNLRPWGLLVTLSSLRILNITFGIKFSQGVRQRSRHFLSQFQSYVVLTSLWDESKRSGNMH